MKKRSGYKFVIFFLMMMGYVSYWLWSYPNRIPQGDPQIIDVSIEQGMPLRHIVSKLSKEGLIEYPKLFHVYAKIKRAEKQIRAGKYQLDRTMSPAQLLKRLNKGTVLKSVSILFPEGITMRDMFALLEKHHVSSAKELMNLVYSKSFLEKHNIDANSCEGYLFPDTYRFFVPTSPQKVLSRMIKQYKNVWNDIKEKHRDSRQDFRKALHWTDHDILILASIVSKEAVLDKERPRIAQVFLNRLMFPSFPQKLLQSDPTIRYGCVASLTTPKSCQGWDVSKRLRRKHLVDETNLYNTYRHKGLPPGPIANPGRASLEAVLTHDGSRYLYFVSKNNGSHAFSKTYKEHRRYVDRYQR